MYLLHWQVLPQLQDLAAVVAVTGQRAVDRQTAPWHGGSQQRLIMVIAHSRVAVVGRLAHTRRQAEGQDVVAFMDQTCRSV